MCIGMTPEFVQARKDKFEFMVLWMRLSGGYSDAEMIRAAEFWDAICR